MLPIRHRPFMRSSSLTAFPGLSRARTPIYTRILGRRQARSYYQHIGNSDINCTFPGPSTGSYCSQIVPLIRFDQRLAVLCRHQAWMLVSVRCRRRHNYTMPRSVPS